MRILILSKRQYTGKDLLDDGYGRVFEIPEELAKRGHDVYGVALSYQNRTQGVFQPGCVAWHSVNARSGLFSYTKLLAHTIETFRPDIIWASSDAFHAILSWRISRRHGVPFVIDLYDNYESFPATRIPGVTSLFRAACRAADGMTMVSQTLEQFVTDNYGTACPRQVIGNAICKTTFRPRPKLASRKALHLPEDARLVGTAGAISSGRGIEVLFEAFVKMARQDPDLWLVYAGPRDSTPARYRHERIIDLGVLKTDCVPELLNALDVAVICNLDSSFGRYCFPQKFYEIVACGTPIAVAATGDVCHLLSPWSETLFIPGSINSLIGCLESQISKPVEVKLIPPGWDDVAAELEKFLLQQVLI